MKKTLKFQLFGNPKIYLADQQIFFSFSKINALLYYLAVNQSISRDEIAGLLWPNKSEQSARKNLRNTIYQANKVLGDDYVVSPNKSVLQLNEDLPVQSDVEEFLSEPTEHLIKYQGEFLKGFFLKDSENFDQWTTRMRSIYEQKFVQNCYHKVSDDIANSRLDDVERNIQRLISIDEYDERNYQLLMRFYQDSHRNGKVIEAYYELVSTLKEELGIEPSDETRKIYEKTLEIVNRRKNYEENIESFKFFGRTQEIETLEANFDGFFHDHNFQSIIIQGDAGIGKTALSELVLNNMRKKHLLLNFTCFHSERFFTLRPWREILQKIEIVIKDNEIVTSNNFEKTCEKFFPYFTDDSLRNFDDKLTDDDINYLSQIILEALKIIEQDNKLIINIDNLQWMDELSLRLLTSLMLHDRDTLFLLTLRSNYQTHIDEFINTVSHYGRLNIIDLKPFDRASMTAFMQKQIPDNDLDFATLTELYNESEGSPFFLMEYVRQIKLGLRPDYMTPKIQKELKFILQDLEPGEEEILEMVSYFPEEAPLKIISTLLNRTESSIAKDISTIKNHQLISEHMIEGEIQLSFFHNKFREFIYSQQAPSKLRVIHEKIAVLLEQKLRSVDDESTLLSQIAYHYKYANQELKSLDYELSHLQISLKFQHELFPIYTEYNKESVELESIEWHDELTKFKQIGDRLKAIEYQYEGNQTYELLLMKYLYFEGRYYINYGNYNQGIENIQRVIVKAKELHHDDFLIRGYRQMIYYYIQTDNATDMVHYIDLAMNISIRSNDHQSIGILLRLKGLYYLMVGNLTEAEHLLVESVTIFTISDEVKEKYSSNIAAAYDYLAEIEGLRENYDEAINYEKKAICLCEQTGLKTSLVIFYVDMGISLYAKEDYEGSKQYLCKAKGLYDNLTSPWKRTQLNAYLALNELHDGDYDAVLRFLLSFNEYYTHLSNPRDMGIVYFIQAIVKKMINDQKISDPSLRELLNQDEAFYLEKAKENLSQYRDRFELQYLNGIYGEMNSIYHH